MAENKNPQATQIGTGAAQVFDQSYLRQLSAESQQYRMQQAAERRKRAEAAEKELRGEMISLRGKTGWSTRDGKYLQDEWRSLNDKYTGRFEEMIDSPELMREYQEDLQNYEYLVARSEQQKADLQQVLQVYSSDKNQDPDSRYYSDDQYSKYEDLISGSAALEMNDEEYQNSIRYLLTPTQNLPDPIDYALEHDKLNPSAWVTQQRQSGYTGYVQRTFVDLDAWKSTLESRYQTDAMFRGAVDNNFGENGFGKFWEEYQKYADPENVNQGLHLGSRPGEEEVPEDPESNINYNASFTLGRDKDGNDFVVSGNEFTVPGNVTSQGALSNEALAYDQKTGKLVPVSQLAAEFRTMNLMDKKVSRVMYASIDGGPEQLWSEVDVTYQVQEAKPDGDGYTTRTRTKVVMEPYRYNRSEIVDAMSTSDRNGDEYMQLVEKKLSGVAGSAADFNSGSESGGGAGQFNR